jgi:hypothetical protein
MAHSYGSLGTKVRLLGPISAVLALFMAAPDVAKAWSLRTHLWIAQEVLDDAADGSVTLAGRSYPLPPSVVEALRAFPGRYRMG